MSYNKDLFLSNGYAEILICNEGEIEVNFGDYLLNKEEAKQIVEHLTKVFEI